MSHIDFKKEYQNLAYPGDKQERAKFLRDLLNYPVTSKNLLLALAEIVIDLLDDQMAIEDYFDLADEALIINWIDNNWIYDFDSQESLLTLFWRLRNNLSETYLEDNIQKASSEKVKKILEYCLVNLDT